MLEIFLMGETFVSIIPCEETFGFAWKSSEAEFFISVFSENQYFGGKLPSSYLSWDQNVQSLTEYFKMVSFMSIWIEFLLTTLSGLTTCSIDKSRNGMNEIHPATIFRFLRKLAKFKFRAQTFISVSITMQRIYAWQVLIKSAYFFYSLIMKDMMHQIIYAQVYELSKNMMHEVPHFSPLLTSFCQ